MSKDNPDSKPVEIDDFPEKIQLIAPAFKEYHIHKDIRKNDQILCKQVHNRLNDIKTELETLRNVMSDKNDFSNMAPIGSIIAQIRHLIEKISKTQQDLIHISPNRKIEEKMLKNLYEYDYNFVSSVEKIFHSVSLTDYISGVSTARTIANKIFPMIENFWYLSKQRSEYVKEITNTTCQ